MSFRGKAIIVTGATSGIGRAAAEAFAREEADVTLTGRDAAALDELAKTMKPPARAIVAVADLADADAPGRIVKATVEAFGGVDVLVNCAGVIATGSVESTTDAEWSRMMA